MPHLTGYAPHFVRQSALKFKQTSDSLYTSPPVRAVGCTPNGGSRFGKPSPGTSFPKVNEQCIRRSYASLVCDISGNCDCRGGPGLWRNCRSGGGDCQDLVFRIPDFVPDLPDCRPLTKTTDLRSSVRHIGRFYLRSCRK